MSTYLPRVSVIIPTYNYGRYLAEAIESVLKQTHPVFEIVVVDDGSTDDTKCIVEGFGERVVLMKQVNRGVGAARNNGIAHSSGELIAFLDADDRWLPEKIEKQVSKFYDDPEIGLVSCGMREFDSDTGTTISFLVQGIEGWIADKHVLFEGPTINVSGTALMVRRHVVDTVGGFDTRLKNGEDWEFCLRVARKYKVGFVAEPLVDYRSHGANASKNVGEMERSTLMAWATAFNTTDANLLRLKRRSYGNLHKVLAGSHLHSGSYWGFARNLIKSLWFRPSFLRYYLSIPFVWKGSR